MVHITRAKNNVVFYNDPPPKDGAPGRPRKYDLKLTLMNLLESMTKSFEKTTIEICSQCEHAYFLCLDLIGNQLKKRSALLLFVTAQSASY